MSVDSVHPEFEARVADWSVISDVYRGQRAVKNAGFRYLPPTPAQVIDGVGSTASIGYKSWASMRDRAVFPEVFSETVKTLMGVMHRKHAVFELPSRLRGFLQRATPHGEGLQQLLERINEEQLIYGRCGLHIDPVDGALPNELPNVLLYSAVRIRNWDDGSIGAPDRQNLNLVVLDESEYVREAGDLDWDRKEKYRVLWLGNLEANEPASASPAYYVKEVPDGGDFDPSDPLEPRIAGRGPAALPFVFINSRDVVPSVDNPPLLSVANRALSAYRMDADFRTALFMTSQETLVIRGEIVDDAAADTRVGAGAVIRCEVDGGASYVGVSGVGLRESRDARDSDIADAVHCGARLIDTRGKEAESGEALRMRVSSRTASLHQVALTGAMGLTSALRAAARWMGLSEAEVESIQVRPNVDFADERVDGRTLVDIMEAKGRGLPWSMRSIHAYLRDHEMTGYDFDEELALIEEEDPISQATLGVPAGLPGPGGGGGGEGDGAGDGE